MTVSEFTGPVKIKRERPTAAFECYCHLCNWVDYKRTEPEARNILVWHLDTAHFNPPKPFKLTAAQMPGLHLRMKPLQCYISVARPMNTLYYGDDLKILRYHINPWTGSPS